MSKTMLMTHLGGPVAVFEQDTSPKPMRNRYEMRHVGQYMGTTRKRDLRIVKHPVFGPEARLKFGPRSSNARTRKVAKRRERHYAKHGVVFQKVWNRDS